MSRRCIRCTMYRRTTNKESPYLCEICLRSDGREHLLHCKNKSSKVELNYKWGYLVMLILLLIGILIGWYFFHSTCINHPIQDISYC